MIATGLTAAALWSAPKPRPRREKGAIPRLLPAHRLDESPAGYSLASCSPAELASASPVGQHCVSGPNLKKANCSERRVSIFAVSHLWGPPHAVPALLRALVHHRSKRPHECARHILQAT